jgi:hypothetical protein
VDRQAECAGRGKGSAASLVTGSKIFCGLALWWQVRVVRLIMCVCVKRRWAVGGGGWWLKHLGDGYSMRQFG